MVLNWVYAKCSVTSLILLTFSSINDATQQDCKFTLLQDSGTFQTPNFPVKYPNDIECVWNIQVQPGRFILLSFDVVELESYRGECIDLVEVKDGSRPTDQLLGSFCDISIVPKVITSSSNTLRIWFYSDKSFANQGFNGSYSSQREKGCGGALTKHSQSISSPRYPDYPYPNSLQCDWVITMPRGKFIRLEFFDFEVEFKCDGKCWCADQLEIWEGPEFNETKLGSFCVSVQELLVSKNNRMRIRFTTNKEGRFKGFLLSYTSSITPGCGGDLTGQSGNITSPYYPMSFPAFSDCVWRVKVPTDRYISLRFLVFTGINGANSECSLDSIEVRDGYSSEASLIDRYCIQNIPPVIVSSGYELYIYFRARSNDEGTPHLNRKFQGSYLTHSYECHESIGLQDGRVRNSQISASSYFTLQLGQGQLHLRPQYGRVGSDYSWCSQTQVLNKIVGEYLQIDQLNYTEITAVATQGYQLHGTDYRGLVSSYKVEYSYDGNRWIAYVDSTKNSTSQGYREFKGNTDFNRVKKNIFMPSIVAKIIRIVPIAYKSYPVKHMCVRAELYGCPYDFAMLRSKNLKAGCGSIVSLQKPGSIAVRGSNQQSKKCTWLSIPSTPSSSNDVITFQFSYFYVPCHHGHVMLHARGDGGKMNTFCGVDPPPVSSLPASTQITLEIKLKKGSPVWGFDLHHKTEYLGCGRIVQVLSNGTVTSPNHPLSYDNNQDCTWILSTNPGSKIKLNFLEFELQPPNQTQCLDFVQVQEGRLDTSTVLGKFCGTSAPVPVISTSNHLRVSFHSDGTTKQKGFLLEYSLVSLKEPESPSPPDYPGRTENTETNPGGATTEHHPNSGRSVDVTTCLVHITMLTCLTLVVY